MALVLDGTLGIAVTGDSTITQNFTVPQNLIVGSGGSISTNNGSVDKVLNVYGGNNVVVGGVSTNVGFGLCLEASRTGRASTARFAQISLGNDASDNGSILFYTAPSGSGVSERMRIASDGQLYHNSTYLVGTAYNHYWAKSTTAISPVSSGWTDVQLQWSNVVIPTNVRKVLLTFHITFRNNGVAVNHSGFRMKVTNTSTSAVTFVGNASWGFGISQCVGNTSGQNHMTVTQHVNLLDYDSSGNQAGLAAGSTYNMMLQVYDAYGNGTTLRLAAEAGNTHENYTPAHGSIWII